MILFLFYLEFSETVTSLLDILHSDPEKRFLVSGK